MNLALVVVGTCILIASGIATRPLRWNWLSSITFTVGWLTSELALQILIADVILLGVALGVGVSGVLGWLGVAANVLACGLLLVHVVSGLRSWRAGWSRCRSRWSNRPRYDPPSDLRNLVASPPSRAAPSARSAGNEGPRLRR